MLTNEQYLSDRPLALGGEMSLRAGRYYAVIDEAMFKACRDKGILAYYGNPKDWYVGATGFTKEKLTNLDSHMAEAVSRKWAVKGTLEQCAAFFGLENLAKTVQQYNALCRAVTPAQEPIPGLYVAGVDNGSLYCSPYYENEGAALGTAYTSGVVAGDCMVKYIRG